MSAPNLIVTDIHHRVTGVGTTIQTLVPYIDEREPLALVASVPHGDRRRLGLWEAYRLCRQTPQGKPFRIWHARRNNEMLWGLVFKHLLRCPLKLVMTSSAIRRHSWFPRQLMAGMDAVIATTDKAASLLKNVVATIPHGVDCRRFCPPADRAVAWREWGLPGERGIGIVGRVRAEKGTDLFVEALVQVLQKFPGYTGCIAGRATLEHQGFQRDLQARIRDAGMEDRFAWLGEVNYEQMPRFHQAMSLVVAPGRYEGYGLVPLEAMACGVPVIASQTGAYAKMVEQGVTGELVPCGDLPALVAALERMLASQAKLDSMAAACREHVERHFSARNEAEQIIDVYQQLWSRAA